MSYDTIVVGAGLAGLTAALRLTEQGQRVMVVARGIGATHLAPATIDVLGYVADARVESPTVALPSLLGGEPEHPYAHLGAVRIAAALTWFCAHTEKLGYTGSLDANMLLPTALGVAKPSALVPQTMAGGDLRAGGRFVFVGFKGFKDFHPSLLADNLTRAELATPVTARALVLDPPPSRRGDLSGRVMAGRFDAGELGDWIVSALDGKVDADERIGIPAVLGLRHADATWQALEAKLGRSIFEVATLPPSIPGIRLYETLAKQLRDAGTRASTAVGSKRSTWQTRPVRCRTRPARSCLHQADSRAAVSSSIPLGQRMRPSSTCRSSACRVSIASALLPGISTSNRLPRQGSPPMTRCGRSARTERPSTRTCTPPAPSSVVRCPGKRSREAASASRPATRRPTRSLPPLHTW
jgi:anaerobic glycerol-3-phosphate dehydrogenase B subunit